MKNRDFNDINQASQYLRNSVILIGGMPCLVQDVYPDKSRVMMSYSRLDNLNETSHISIKDKAVDMNPVPLGMLPIYGTKGGANLALYVSRYPARKWHVGLARDNLAVHSLLGGGDMTRAYASSILPSKFLEDCILGKYKSLEEVCETFEKVPGTIPLSRRFAVSNKGELIYKTLPEKVGSFTKKGAKLSSAYSYLQEALQEDINAHN